MATQINSVKIDQQSTFDTARLMQVQPEMEFGSKTDQAKTKDDIPKWVASVAVTFTNSFGQQVAEVIPVKIASMEDPGKDVVPFNPITLHGFAMFVQPKTNKDRQQVPGMTQSFSAGSITDNAATGVKSAPKAAATTGGDA